MQIRLDNRDFSGILCLMERRLLSSSQINALDPNNVVVSTVVSGDIFTLSGAETITFNNKSNLSDALDAHLEDIGYDGFSVTAFAGGVMFKIDFI